jgi:hypothetical protein
MEMKTMLSIPRTISIADRLIRLTMTSASIGGIGGGYHGLALVLLLGCGGGAGAVADAAADARGAGGSAGGGRDAFVQADASRRLDAAIVLDGSRPDAPRADAGVDAPVDAMADARVPDAAATAWRAGPAPGRAPGDSLLEALPGGGVGPPVFTSNNPETFTGTGFLYQAARPAPTRGGTSHPLSGRFGVYLHHLTASARPLSLVLFVTNPGTAPVTVSARGSGYAQGETPGLPDPQVALEWLTDAPATTVPATALPSERPLAIWTKTVPPGREVDGRFEVEASAPVYVYLVATENGGLDEAVALSRTEAPGNIHPPGNPPPPLGREAGVYAHDRWRGVWSVDVPPGPAFVGYPVNTATGGGYRQVQAFPALTRFADSSAEAVGMYGNTYDLTVTLRHDGGPGDRRVRVLFAGNVAASSALSFQWNGPVRTDGQVSSVRLTPAAPVAELVAPLTLRPGEARTVHVELPVPGLISITEALILEAL